MADDDKVSRRYRELAREEPPRHVDEAILATARRAVDARPAPLVSPGGRRRWYFPLAAAAIIVLAVAVTVQVDREQKESRIAEGPVAAPAPAREALTQTKPTETPPQSAAVSRAKSPPAAAPAAPAAREAPARQEAADALREAPEKEAAPRARGEVAAGAVARAPKAAPEQWLERIADLRRQGRHEDADKALAEFRRAYPDYRIPEAMLEKVERR